MKIFKNNRTWILIIAKLKQQYFNENYSLTEGINYAHDKCYVRADRSQPEKIFEQLLSQSQNVAWWWKNGIEKETCFAIEYQDPKSEVMRAFYPDYIVCYADDSMGIYDTKSGIIAEMNETKVKSNALRAYIKKHVAKNLKGGIVQSTSTGMYVFEGDEYNANIFHADWKRFDE